MSTNILHIDSSIFGEGGVSSQLGAKFTALLSEALATATVNHRDLAKDAIPHFDAATIAAIGEGKAALADTLIAEVQGADIVVLGVPMYNFGVPSMLKAWFDHIARAGVTFKYTDTGPVGLLSNKKVVVITSRGGMHKDASSDSQTPFLSTMLGFLGLNDVTFVYAEGLNLGGDSRTSSIAKAEQHISKIVSELTA